MSYYIDQLEPGMSASTSKTVTEADIILFAGISTDVNPAHLDEEYCKGTMFGTRIAGKRHDIGNKLDFIKTNIRYALKHPEMKDALAAYIKELAAQL